MVRLVGLSGDQAKQMQSSFNSSVVRLVADKLLNLFLYRIQFQFQCGAIGSPQRNCQRPEIARFNSSVVRLVESASTR